MNTLPPDDASFIREALRGGRQEVADSREAVTRDPRGCPVDGADADGRAHDPELNSRCSRTRKAGKPWNRQRRRAGRTAAATPTEGVDFDHAYITTRSAITYASIAIFRLKRRMRTMQTCALAAKALPKLEQHLAALKKRRARRRLTALRERDLAPERGDLVRDHAQLAIARDTRA
jgi:hypothetical protein